MLSLIFVLMTSVFADEKSSMDMVSCFGFFEDERGKISCLAKDGKAELKKVTPVKAADFPTPELRNLALIEFMKRSGFKVLSIVPAGIYFVR
jgi:hypothetical protein